LYTNEFLGWNGRNPRLVRYAKPCALDEALALMSEDRWRVLAGGTDFYPALGTKPITDNVLDINGLAELRGISETPTHVAIGARTTWSDVVKAVLPPAFDALKQAAREIGSVQIQNAGTVAGNLCNASPAADGVPALMILDAEVEIASAAARRTVPLEAFILGNRKTALAPDELVTAVRLPKASLAGASSFFKLGARRYLVISIAMTAVRIAVDSDGFVAQAAIAVGACSVVAKRLRGLEQSLIGRDARTMSAEIPGERFFAELSPIDDVRGSAEYRQTAAREIVGRALTAAAQAALTPAALAKECAA
jgi:CO/xanthine dehydrogenase FAD-binding subunit